MVGQTVSHFRILEKLGSGGMGVVYKARDTRLDRYVALKLLRPEIIADPELRHRLVQEAKAASALNHPHIVQVYEIDHQGDFDFMAMEYVDGKTLDQLIPRNGMTLSQVLTYSIQIADALAAAHSAGIVHRDVKPGNVIVNGKGQIKLTDFGLAKLGSRCASTASDTTETIKVDSAPHTGPGTVLGSIGYMSPEQVEAKTVDARSDIFSMGTVMYEMATGRRAFRSDSDISTLAAILSKEPDPLGSEIPHELEKIIKRCLSKAPGRRYQDMYDVKIALEELKDDSDSGKLAVFPARQNRIRPWLWASASVAALMLATLAMLTMRQSPIDLKPGVLTSYPGFESEPSFSPDGKKIAFVWNGDKEDNFDIYIKQIGGVGPPLRLTTQPAAESSPAWSPDDRWIAFMRALEGKVAISVIPPLAGPERTLVEISRQSFRTGLSWTPDGKWLAFSAQNSVSEPLTIRAISVETGEQRQLTTFPAKSRIAGNLPLGDYYPAFSPNGHALAFVRQSSMYVFELYILPIRPEMQASEPSKVTEQHYSFLAGAAWTSNGREIVYGYGALWRVPASGTHKPQQISFIPAAGTFPAIARSVPRLAYTWFVRNTNVWRLNTRTGERKMLIGSTYVTDAPQYSPDGQKIAFQSNRTGTVEVWTCDADGSNCVQLTSFEGPQCGAPSWSPDARWLAFDSRVEGQPEIYVIPAGGGTPRRLTEHPANDILPNWSRDGRWIYFTSDRLGQNDIWKVSKDGGEPVRVTVSGGVWGVESLDGKYLYYSEPKKGALYRMRLQGGESIQVLSAGVFWNFAVTDRGIYFLSSDQRKLQFMDLATHGVNTLATLDKPGYHLTVSPDGRYVLWPQLDRETQDLMLVEGFR